ncbi:MAG: nuclease-related domain-containing protein [Rariglobus sp.]
MHWIFLGVYGLIFLAVLTGAAFWSRNRRKTRAPFPENAKLLRGPGETLRKKLGELDERLIFGVFLAMILPLIVGLGLATIATKVEGTTHQAIWLAIAVVGLMGTLILVIRRLVRSLERWRNTWLGFFGERMVGEALEPLKTAGFRIFHDVPAGDAKSPFNIDHVIVGPSGVFAVETKTRRKGRARQGYADHQIVYDGNVLSYPWGEDRFGLDQAQRQSVWLQAWLEQLLGQPTPVMAILTFPGWMILRRGRGVVNVLNPREIPAAVAQRGPAVLDDRQIDLVSRQLDVRCRDVEF